MINAIEYQVRHRDFLSMKKPILVSSIIMVSTRRAHNLCEQELELVHKSILGEEKNIAFMNIIISEFAMSKSSRNNRIIQKWFKKSNWTARFDRVVLQIMLRFGPKLLLLQHSQKVERKVTRLWSQHWTLQWKTLLCPMGMMGRTSEQVLPHQVSTTPCGNQASEK